jgi:ankyrin repeat protein
MNLEVARAAAVGDVETVNKWLTARGYTHDQQLAIVMHQAVRHGHEIICQLLLYCRAISIDEQLMDMALKTACEFNQLSIAKRVIKHCSKHTHTLTEALLKASVRGHVHIVEWLISDVMHHLSHTDRIRWTFVTACVRGDLSDIQQLAKRVHSDVTSVMNHALRVACYNGRHDVVKWLTSHTTADVSSAGVLKTNNRTMTSLMAACFMGHNRIAIQLLQCVTPHTVNMMSGEYGDTALHLICFSEIDGRLFNACVDGDIDCMSDLLYTSDVNFQGRNGATSMHVACRSGHVEATRLLLSVFARTDITDINRDTPVMVAQKFKYTILLPHLRRTLTDTSDINCTSTRVTDTSTDTVTISLSSIADAQQNNTKSRKSNQVIKSTSIIKRIV